MRSGQFPACLSCSEISMLCCFSVVDTDADQPGDVIIAVWHDVTESNDDDDDVAQCCGSWELHAASGWLDIATNQHRWPDDHCTCHTTLEPSVTCSVSVPLHTHWPVPSQVVSSEWPSSALALPPSPTNHTCTRSWPSVDYQHWQSYRPSECRETTPSSKRGAPFVCLTNCVRSQSTCTKIDCDYRQDELLMELLWATRSVADDIYIFQQDNAPASRARLVKLRNSLLPILCSPAVRLITTFGEWCRNESTITERARSAAEVDECSQWRRQDFVSGRAQVWRPEKTENNKCMSHHPRQQCILLSMRYCIRPVCHSHTIVKSRYTIGLV